MSKTNKTHWRVFHPTNYIGAHSFQEGERKVLTISKAGWEKVSNPSGKADDCLVIHFAENEKPMIVNVTNSKAIEKVSGSGFVEDWKGVKIELFTTEVNAFGELQEAVRIKQTAPRVTKPELTEQHEAYPKVFEAVQSGYTRAQVEKKYTVSDKVWDTLTEPQEGE